MVRHYARPELNMTVISEWEYSMEALSQKGWLTNILFCLNLLRQTDGRTFLKQFSSDSEINCWGHFYFLPLHIEYHIPYIFAPNI